MDVNFESHHRYLILFLLEQPWLVRLNRSNWDSNKEDKIPRGMHLILSVYSLLESFFKRNLRTIQSFSGARLIRTKRARFEAYCYFWKGGIGYLFLMDASVSNSEFSLKVIYSLNPYRVHFELVEEVFTSMRIIVDGEIYRVCISSDCKSFESSR